MAVLQQLLLFSLFFNQVYISKCGEFRIPFSMYKNSKESSDFSIVNNIFFNIIYVNLSIGTPPQNISFSIDINSEIFTVYNKLYNNSITYEEISKYENDDDNEFTSSGFKAMDILTINNKKEKINFILSTKINYENFPFGIIGLSIPKNIKSEVYPFMNSLKKAKYIDSFTWTLKYFNNQSLLDALYSNENNNKIIGEFIFGNEPHNYEKDKSKYNKSQLIKINPLSSYDYSWEINFDKIYFFYREKTNNKNETEQKININLYGRTKLMPQVGFIFIPKEFYYFIRKRFFEPYMDNKICRYRIINNTIYDFIECDNNSSFKLSSFPDICFEHKEFETTFNFTYKDLFLYDKNRDTYVFLMISDKYLHGWIFGAIFLKKYQLIFNQDSKTIGYYKSMNKYIEKLDNKNDYKNQNRIEIINNIRLGILLIISSFLLIILGMFIQKYFCKLKKKLKANELEESFSYQDKKNDETLYEEKKSVNYSNI